MTRAKIVLIAGILVIAGLVGAGAWWMMSRGGASGDQVGEAGGSLDAGGNGSGATVGVRGPEDGVAQEEVTDPLKRIRDPERVIYLKPGSIGEEGVESQVTLAELIEQREPPDPQSVDSGSVVIPDPQAGSTGPSTDGTADPDGDALTNDQERALGTAPNRADTDEDGLGDGDEVRTRRTDPKRADTDGDGLRDGEEVTKWKTDPLNPDTDNDTYPDGTEVKGGYNPRGSGKL